MGTAEFHDFDATSETDVKLLPAEMDQEYSKIILNTPGRIVNNIFTKSLHNTKNGFSDYGFSQSSYKDATSEFKDLKFNQQRNLPREEKTVSSFGKLNDFEYLNY